MLDMGGYGCGARFFLELAIKRNDIALAEWILAHGASPNAPPATDRRHPKVSLYEVAVLSGADEIADLLARRGATATPIELDDAQAFRVACMRLDRDRVRLLAARHPEYLRAHAVMFAAAEQDRVEL